MTLKLEPGFYGVGQDGKLYKVEFPVGLKASRWIDLATGKICRMTNRERYRRMSNREFAEVLLPKENPETGYLNCKGCPLEDKDCSESDKSCQELVAGWLNEETEQ